MPKKMTLTSCRSTEAPSHVNALDNVCSSHHVLLFSVTESGLFLQTYTFSVVTDCWLVLQFYLVLTTLSTWELWHQTLETPQHFIQPCCASGWSSFFLAHRLYHLLEQLASGKVCICYLFGLLHRPPGIPTSLLIDMGTL